MDSKPSEPRQKSLIVRRYQRKQQITAEQSERSGNAPPDIETADKIIDKIYEQENYSQVYFNQKVKLQNIYGVFSDMEKSFIHPLILHRSTAGCTFAARTNTAFITIDHSALIALHIIPTPRKKYFENIIT